MKRYSEQLAAGTRLFIRRGCNRQGNGESAAPVFPFALGGNGPAVQFHQLPDDRQPQAQSSMFSSGGRIRLSESFKEVRKEIGRNPFSGVANDNLEKAS